MLSINTALQMNVWRSYCETSPKQTPKWAQMTQPSSAPRSFKNINEDTVANEKCSAARSSFAFVLHVYETHIADTNNQTLSEHHDPDVYRKEANSADTTTWSPRTPTGGHVGSGLLTFLDMASGGADSIMSRDVSEDPDPTNGSLLRVT